MRATIPASTIIPVFTSLVSFKRFCLWLKTKLEIFLTRAYVAYGYFKASDIETRFPFL